MTNQEITESLLALALAMTVHVNRCTEPRVNAMESTMTSTFRDFERMNPSIFLVSMIREDPQECLDSVYKVWNVIGVTSREMEELASYQLRKVSQVWYT